jgi:hypothetical protein
MTQAKIILNEIQHLIIHLYTVKPALVTTFINQ